MRLLDAMILIYFAKVGLPDALLQLPGLGITSSVRRELRPSSTAREAVEAALTDGALSLCDVDPANEVQRMLYVMYRDGDGFLGFGDGEATSMAVAHSRGFTFVSHDRKARERGRRRPASSSWTGPICWPNSMTPA